MSNRTTITKRDAERVLALVKSQNPAYLEDGYGPTLVADWNYTLDNPYAWAIIWEEGPYEWALRFPFGGVDDEMTDMMQEFRPGSVSHTKDVGAGMPDHVYASAITSWAIGIALV